jgi:tyrosinase
MNWRRNVASLSQKEKDNYIQAVKAMKTRDYNPKVESAKNQYDQYVVWHNQAALQLTPLKNKVGRTSAHSGPAFLPWHRESIINNLL